MTSLVRQGWRERKGDPSPNPPDSHCQHCLLLPSLLWKGSEAAEQGGNLQGGKLPIPTSAANLILHEAGREMLHWFSSVLSEPFPAHSRPGRQATAGRTSRTTGLRGHHLSSEEAAACAALEGKEHSFVWLHLALTSTICQHSLCCIAASQDRNGIVHPSARHTDVPQKSRGGIFHIKRDL